MTDAAPFWRTPLWWRRAGGAAAGLWIGTLIGLTGTIVAARGLGPDEFGALALAEATCWFVVVVLDISLEDALLHYGTRLLDQQDHRGLRRLMRFGFTFDLLLGLVVCGALVALADPIAGAVRDTLDPDLVRMGALVLLTRTVDGATGVALLLVRRPDLRAWSSTIGNGVRLAAIVAVLAGDHGALAVFAAYAIGGASGSLLQLWWAWRHGWGHWPETGPGERVATRPLLSFAVHSSITSSLSIARETLTTLIVGSRAGERAAGLFAVALFPVTGAQVLGSTMRLVSHAEQNAMFVEGDFPTLRRSIRLQTLVGAAAGALLSVAGWIAMPHVLEALYGDDFTAATTPARILLVTAVAVLAVGWSKTLPSAVGQPRVRTAMTLVDLAILAPTLWYVADRHGVRGAAITLSALTVATSIVWWAIAERLIPEGAGRR